MVDKLFVGWLVLTIVLSILFLVFNSKDPIPRKDKNDVIMTDSNGKIIYEQNILPLIFGVLAFIFMIISICWIASFWM